MAIVGYFSAIIIGVLLGLIGGGGSILTMPILVFLFKINPLLSTSYSLFIVGVTALFGCWGHYRMGNLHLKTAVFFALPSIIAIVVIRKYILPIIPNDLFTINQFLVTKSILIMVIFAALMITASISMIKQTAEIVCNEEPNATRLMLIGFFTGLVTGFLGAGGGFLIIPALVFFAGKSMKQAVGTSLVIIAFNSLIGFTGDILNAVKIDFPFILTIAAIAVSGIFIGTYLSKQIDGKKLKPLFGWFVLMMGLYIIAKEIFY